LANVAVLGAGSWGTALAVLLAKKGHQTILWGRNIEMMEKLSKLKENTKYLPGVQLPASLKINKNLALAVKDADALVLAVPSHGVRELCQELGRLDVKEPYLINTAKGFEVDTLKRLSQVILEELSWGIDKTVVLSGPSHAEEVGNQLPTAVVAAAKEREAAEYVQDLFITPKFRVYTNPDVIGVELGGALKNVIALGTGICDGLGLGDNTKAALITRGLAEIGRLGVTMKANPLTFAGLAGVGDLVVTCTSQHSRNRKAGVALGQGLPLDQVLAKVGMVVEGIRATKAAYNLAKLYQVEMPIVEQAYYILFEQKPIKEAVTCLMERSRTHEVEDILLTTNGW
jgi:glycerol-3-phosphate dehydrogenase (NAD(P)+)